MTAIDETIERMLTEATRTMEEGRPQDAIPLADRAQVLAEKACGEGSEESAECLDMLGRARHASNRHDEAARTLEEVVVREKVLGPDSPLTGFALLRLGAALAWGSTTGSSSSAFKRGLDIIKNGVVESPDAYEQSVLFAAEHYEQALGMFDVAALILRNATTAFCRAGVGHCENVLRLCTALQERAGNRSGGDTDAKAESNATANPPSAMGTPEGRSAVELLTLGKAEAGAGRWRESIALSIAALSQSFARETEDKDTVQTEIAEEIGEALTKQGAPEAAEPWLGVAYYRRKHFQGDHHVRTAMALSHLATAYDKQNRLKEGEKAHRIVAKTFAEYGEDPGPIHVYQFSSLEWLADNLVLQGRYDEAETLLEGAIEMQEQAKLDSPVIRMMTWHRLKGVYLGQKRFEAARDLLEKLAAEYERFPGGLSETLAETLRELAGCYDQLGDRAKAAATRARISRLPTP